MGYESETYYLYDRIYSQKNTTEYFLQQPASKDFASLLPSETPATFCPKCCPAPVAQDLKQTETTPKLANHRKTSKGCRPRSRKCLAPPKFLSPNAASFCLLKQIFSDGTRKASKQKHEITARRGSRATPNAT
jgi:hypothetical protein